MIIRKAFKFRLNMKPGKEEKFFQFAGCARFVWNKALAMNLERLNNKQPILYYQELDFWSKIWKKSDEYRFLKDCQAHVIQQKLKDLQKAFLDAFDKKQPNKRIPRFKKRNGDNSFRYPQHFQINGNNIYLPKLGWFSFRQSRQLVGKPKNVTVSYYCCHWYVSIQTEQEVVAPSHPKTDMVGIDMGVARFATCSDGKVIKAKNHFKRLSRKLKIAQRSLSRKEKFSSNWKKQKERIQNLHARIANARKDYLHWHSNRLSQNHATIVMEDLQVKNMSKSAKGTLEEPGKNVRAKSGLNRAILDQGWGEFKRQLKYKLEWLGGELLLVDPKYTSQTCPSCQHVAKENRQSQADFHCVACGYHENADLVGAMNVCRAGHAHLACGDTASVSLGAQESTRVAA